MVTSRLGKLFNHFEPLPDHVGLKLLLEEKMSRLSYILGGLMAAGVLFQSVLIMAVPA